jgi:hypothetical protein
VRLNISRYTKNKNGFVLVLSGSGNFVEVETGYDIEFIKRKCEGSDEGKAEHH